MVYTFSDSQARKLKGYFNKMRKEGKSGYDIETLNKASDHRLFCEYFEGVARGYIKDEEFFSKFHPEKLPWFYDELLKVGPQGIARTKVLGYLSAINDGVKPQTVVPESAKPRRDTGIHNGGKSDVKEADNTAAPLSGTRRKKTKQLVSMKIDPDLYEQAKIQAQKEERTFAGLVRFLLAQHIQENS